MSEVVEEMTIPEQTPFQVLDLPLAKLQIVQTSSVLKENWLDRSMLEPKLSHNDDDLWMLTVRRQGEHSKFEVPYIGSEILLADAELGLVVVVVGYHGAYSEKYGSLGYMTQKGQFYRFYQQQAAGDWIQTPWRALNDSLRQLIITTVQEHGPAWAKVPGKLRSERNVPAKPVTLTTYKVVRVIDARYYSLYDPTVEYVLGERVKQLAKPKHGGGFYSYPTLEMGTEFLADCVVRLPYHEEVVTPHLALLECEASGRIVHYGHKMASTYLCPLRVLEIRTLA